MSDHSTGGDHPRPGHEPTQAMPAASPPPPAPPPPVSKPADSEGGRRWKTWHMVVAALLGLFFGIGIGAAGGETNDDQSDAEVAAAQDSTTTTEDSTTTTEATTTTTTEASTTTEAPTTTTTTTTAPPPPQDVEVASYSGSGGQSMRPFTISDGWEIQWDFTGDYLGIYLHDEDGSPVAVLANQQGSGSGASYQGRGGTFYIETNAIGDWTIRVVDVP